MTPTTAITRAHIPVQAAVLHQPRATAGHERTQRRDIQGLRAIAVLAVLLYHLWPHQVVGGFVGVDVFFVISGFLITGNLLREFDRSGRLRLAAFWARRAKRLLPASLLVLAATTVAIVVVVPLSLQRQFLMEVLASTFYAQNWLLARNSVDYLAATNTASPVQHFWTLAVEEQFYVAVPLLLSAALAIPMLRRRAGLFAVLAAAAGVSFAYTLHLSATSASVAYFSTATRAWEFLAGSLLAFAGTRLPARARASAVLAGLSLIGVSVMGLGTGTKLTGAGFVLPVLGTVLVIAAGPGGLMDRLTCWRPIQTVGAISYGLYLWHWPLIVLVPYALGRPITTLDKVVIAVVSVVLAWACTTWVESPIRFSARLLGERRPRAVGVWMGATTLVTLALVVGALQLSQRSVHEVQAQQQHHQSVLQGNRHCFGANAIDAPAGRCSYDSQALTPDPVVAINDDRNLPQCWSTRGVEQVRVCQLGPRQGYQRRVLAIGDSHNAALTAAYEQVARINNWRVDLTGHNGCYWTAAQQHHDVNAEIAVCDAWKANVEKYLAEQPPYDAILTTNSTHINPVIPGPGQSVEEATVQGMRAVWQRQINRGVVIIGVRDVPGLPSDTTQCVETHRTNADTACGVSSEMGLGEFDAISPAVAGLAGAQRIDLGGHLCPNQRCEAVIGSVLVFRTRDHLTQTFSRTLGPFMAREAQAALQRGHP